jgi:hypothetical protein
MRHRYLVDTPEQQAAVAKIQYCEASFSKMVGCPCGKMVKVENAYRCLYCRVYFCATCAEKHFGKSRRRYKAEMRRA